MYNISVGDSPNSGTNNLRSPATFYYRQVLNSARSQIEARPVYEDQLYVKISNINDKFTVVDRPATERDKLNYIAEYTHFERKATAAREGISLDVIFPRASANAVTLREQGIQTIEQLVDTVIPGLEYLSEKAKRYLSYITDSKRFHQEFEELLAVKDRQIVALKKQVETISAQFQAYIATQDRAKNVDGFIDTNEATKVGFDSQEAQIIANARNLVDSIRNNR